MASEFSVLMAVYGKDTPEFFQQALASVFDQTLPPQELVLVEDGPLTPELSEVVREVCLRYPGKIRVLSLPVNGGLGPALNWGLTHCRTELVARMDSDDICKSDRFERQVNEMDKHSEIDVLGGWLEEFSENPSVPDRLKTVPLGGTELVRYAKKRNPLNHPTVIFRKSSILAVGSYEDVPYFEDYHLWAKLLVSGRKLANLPVVLLSFRTNQFFLDRRTGKTYASKEREFLKRLRHLHFLSFWQWWVASVLRSAVRLLPTKLVKKIYVSVLRGKGTS